MSTFKPNLHVKDLFVCLCWLRRYILAFCTQYSDHIATAGKGVLLYMLYSQTSPRSEPWTIWNRPTCFSEKPSSPPGMLSRSLTLRSTTTTPSVLASELDNATGLTTIGQLKVPEYNETGAQRLGTFWSMSLRVGRQRSSLTKSTARAMRKAVVARGMPMCMNDLCI